MTSSIRLDYTPRALRDIASILQYTLKTWGSDQENVYREILKNAFRLLQQFPDLGHPAEGKPSDIREYHLRHHIIRYRRGLDSVTIIRIVSPRRGRR